MKQHVTRPAIGSLFGHRALTYSRSINAQDPIDVLFVLDRSRSSTKLLTGSRGTFDTFEGSKTLVEDIISVIVSKSQVAVISFSESAVVELGYNRSDTQDRVDDLIVEINAIQAPSGRNRGQSNLSAVLDTSRSINNPDNAFGSRPGAKQFVLLFTDGKNDPGGDGDPFYQASLKEFHRQVCTTDCGSCLPVGLFLTHPFWGVGWGLLRLV